MQIAGLGRTVLAFFLMAFAAAWEAEWIHGVQPTDQEKFMDVTTLKDLRQTAKGELTKKPLPWYTLADFTNPRLEPLCALRVMQVKDGKWKLYYCSCSFVKLDMVATAAHCLTKAKVTPKSEHAIWVQQLYGNGNDPDFSKYPVNMVTEWWYPAAYAAGGLLTHDIALLRTKTKGSKAYQMMEPIDVKQGYNVQSDQVFMIGYPKDAAASEAAVVSNGKFDTIDKDKTVVENTYPYFPKLYPDRRPMMMNGASGGPIIVSDATLAKYKANADALEKDKPEIAEGWAKAADTIKMGLFGVLGQARTSEPFNMNAALQITNKLLMAVNLIYSKGTKGATVEKRANDDELVKLKGI